MTTGRHQGSPGSIFAIFAAAIRQIISGIAASAIGAPTARVLTQPGPTRDIGYEISVQRSTGQGAAIHGDELDGRWHLSCWADIDVALVVEREVFQRENATFA